VIRFWLLGLLLLAWPGGWVAAQARRFIRVLTWPPAVRVYQMDSLGSPEYLGLSNGEPLELRVEVEGEQLLAFEYISPLPFRAWLDPWLGAACPQADFAPHSAALQQGWVRRVALADTVGPIRLPLSRFDAAIEYARELAPLWLGLLGLSLLWVWRGRDRIRLQLVTAPPKVELVTGDQALSKDWAGRWWISRRRLAEVLALEVRAEGYLPVRVQIPRAEVLGSGRHLRWPQGELRLLVQDQRQLWELVPGDEVMGCRIEERRGEGVSSVVYRARRAGESVALKLLKPAILREADLLPRFRREMESLSQLRHPAIPALLDFGEFHSLPFLVMEWLPGQSLERCSLPLPAGQALLLLRQLAQALEAAHHHGILHRDLKPANVMVEGSRAWLTDFGLARGCNSSVLTAEGVVLGTPAYLAPEVLMGEPASPHSEQYSLACVALEMLQGQPPYRGDSMLAIAVQHLHSPPPDVSNLPIPAGLARRLEQMLAKAPGERLENLQPLICALLDFEASP